MGKNIDKITEERIKDAADIVDVVSDFVTLKKSGKDYVGLCPFHDDKHIGSFVVSSAKNVCKCFSCMTQALNPVDFVMKAEGLKYGEALRWLASKYGIIINDEKPMPIQAKKATPRAPRPELPMFTLPLDMVKSKIWNKVQVENTLVAWLRALPWNEDEATMLDKWLGYYAVGTVAKDQAKAKTKGWTMWWYIDADLKPRTAKVMAYLADGHRDKFANPYMKNGVQKYYNFDFIHSMLSRERNEKWGRKWLFDEDAQKMEMCLFGLHLVDVFPDAEICIVESEKTAIIAQTLAMPGEKLFMATASKSSLTRAMLQPLIDRNRKIVLYPDVDGVETWKKEAEKIDYDKIMVSDRMLRLYKKGVDPEKADIADCFVRMLYERKGNVVGKVTEQLGTMTAPLKKLIEDLQLEIV